MASIKPYKIAVPDSAIEQLKAKLSSASFPDEVEFSDSWDYGVPLKDIKRLAKHWQNGFDWRAAEAKLNEELPQFTTTVTVEGFDPLNLHFVHQRSSRSDSIPLLFCHGWPGSFLEVAKILPLLTDAPNGMPSFDVVAPSLPNFGFSGGVTKPGFAPPQYAEACHGLMAQLGYAQYVTQGGDWGFVITRLMGIQHPEAVLASHLNFVRVTAPPTLRESPGQYLRHALVPLTAHERAGLARTRWFREHGYGYNLEQSTRPHTIGPALRDSPVALLAWVYEKLHDWTDGYPWADDEALAWVSVYAFSAAGPDASVRIYYEAAQARQRGVMEVANGWVGRVPLGLSYFPRDLVVPPSSWGRTLGPVVFERRHEDGGHFAAYERPEKLAGDLRDMFGKGGGAEHVAKQFRTQARI